MADERLLKVLIALVEAHEKILPNTGAREPIYFLKHLGGAHLQHHGFAEGEHPEVDETLINELSYAGLLDIDWSGDGRTMILTPSPLGRETVQQHARVMSTEPVADLTELIAAIEHQAAADSKLAWPAVRPVLHALRSYWEAGGFSPHGIQLLGVIHAVPDEHEAMFVATIRQFVRGDYLQPTNDLGLSVDLPAEVALTDRAFAILDGWPGATPADLVENLLAVIAAEAAQEPDEARKSRLLRLGETVREVGVAAAGDVLSKVMTGGL